MNPLPKRFRALLVDDEMMALRNLRSQIEEHCGDVIEICGMANSGTEAELLIKALQPQVLFLDIQLRSETAFQFLDRIKPFSFDVIFVTAYDKYALQALKLNALDYILKPICDEELTTAVGKLARGAGRFPATDYRQLDGNGRADRIVLKNSTDMRVVLFDDLLYLEARRSYSLFCFQDAAGRVETMLISKPISDYAELLPEALFFRIHKSYIVNSRYVSRFCIGKDQYKVVLREGTELPLSRRRYMLLQEQLRVIGS